MQGGACALMSLPFDSLKKPVTLVTREGMYQYEYANLTPDR